MAEEFARKFGCAVCGVEPTQVAAGLAAGAIGQFARGAAEAVGVVVSVAGRCLAVVAAHVEQAGFGAVAQGHHVHAWGHCKQDVAHLHLFARAVARSVCRMVAAAGFFGGFGQLQFMFQPRVDGGRGGFADDAIYRCCIVFIQQAVALCRLAQEFGASALAQLFAGQRFILAVQGHAVDARHRHGGRRRQAEIHRFKAHAVQPSRGWLWPAGTFRRRLRTTWCGRKRKLTVAKPLHTCTSRLKGKSRKIVMPKTMWNR